ncbi:MAG: ParA family protein [Burkholderiaceae bacterium]
MPIILIANPKGGVGKTTTATNLAGFYAGQGHRTMLGDLDRQQSAVAWLGIRPSSVPVIESWDRSDGRIARAPAGITHVVLDTPAGLRGGDLKDALKLADRVIVPLQPSIFDIFATQNFLAKLAERGALSETGKVGVLGMRVDQRTRAAEQLHRFVEGLGLPVVGYLRATQNYVHLAAQGLTLWDIAPARVAQDREQWQPLLAWLNE